MTPEQHLSQAHDTLGFARFALQGGYADKAGREAYLAALHAALAFVAARTGRTPRTHSGARSEFARLALNEPVIGREFVAFLGAAYELKTLADYGQKQPVPAIDAERAIATAERMTATIQALLAA